MPVTQIPKTVAALSDAFVAGLEETLPQNFAGLFLYGAACFPPSSVIDFDGHVLLNEPLTDDDRKNLDAMHARLRALPLGDEMDVWYITIDDARSTKPPTHQRNTTMSDGSWALIRAHVHAGRFIQTAGPDPREIVPVPTWPELDDALLSELRWLSDHFDDAPAYVTLNLCRILASYENRDVVLSKLQAGIWAIGALDVDHHPKIRAALSSYEAAKSGADVPELEDVKTFYEEMTGKIERARTLG
jgi:hypothetical protein